MKLIAMLLLAYSFNAHGANFVEESPKPTEGCELCVKIDKIKKSADDNEKKAARDLAELLDKVEFSKDKKIHKQEFDHLMSAAALLIEKDERREIPQYLVDIEDESPEEFKEALKALPESDQKTIKDEMGPARTLFEKGEEP